MPDLAPLSALGASAARRLRHAALVLEENPGLALASLALRRGVPRPNPFGLTLPEPGGWVAANGVAAFWTGPEHWIIEAEARAESDFAAALAAEAPGQSVTEQTDAFAAFEITSEEGAGPIRGLLEKLVNIDPALLPAGSATRTGLEHLSVFVIRRSESRLAVLGMRSAAGTIWHALESAIRRRPA